MKPSCSGSKIDRRAGSTKPGAGGMNSEWSGDPLILRGSDIYVNETLRSVFATGLKRISRFTVIVRRTLLNGESRLRINCYETT